MLWLKICKTILSLPHVPHGMHGNFALPCWAEASTTCHTEFWMEPNAVCKVGCRPSLRTAYRAGHSLESASWAQAGVWLESPRMPQCAWFWAAEKWQIICSTASLTAVTSAVEMLQHYSERDRTIYFVSIIRGKWINEVRQKSIEHLSSKHDFTALTQSRTCCLSLVLAMFDFHHSER